MSELRPLHFFLDEPLDGATNMARDEHLLYSDEIRPAALRLYGWNPATISLGYFQKHAMLDELPGDLRKLSVVRRQTGGGAILHDREITYSLILDDSTSLGATGTTALYEMVHRIWCDIIATSNITTALAPDHFPLPTPRTGPFFCFEKPGRTDVLHEGKKLIGSAQRRIPGRVLQHGSLLLSNRFANHPGADLGLDAHDVSENWCKSFADVLASRLNLELRATAWTDEQLHDVAVRRARFADANWTNKY